MNGRIDAPSGPVAPFGVSSDRLPLLNAPFGEILRAELATAGITPSGSMPVGGAGTLVVGPDVFVNAACIRAFLARCGPEGGRLRLVSPGWARAAGGPDARDVDVSLIVSGHASGDAAARAGLPPVEVDAEETSFAVARGPEAFDVPAPRHVAARVETWADLLWLNLFCMTARVRNLSRARGAAIVLGAALRARSLNPWRVAGRLVEKGRGCDVHPSAVVEASMLGDGVRIGPGAVVRGAILGAGVEVEELALVAGSVVGPDSRVQRQAMLKFSVAGSRVSTGGVVQLSVLADGSSTRSGSWILDRRLDGAPVQVAAAGGLADAGPALGVALGPGAAVGSGVWIAPGRAIPAGVVVTRARQDVLARVPQDLAPGTYAVEEGGAVPVGAAPARSAAR